MRNILGQVALGGALVLASCSAGTDGADSFGVCPGGICGPGPQGDGDNDEAGDTQGESGETSGASADEESAEDTNDTQAAGGLPCDVQDAFAAACGMCHSDPPSFGAPMPLTTFDDLHVPAATDPTRAVFEVVQERMTAATNPMPPSAEITPEDKATILDWIAAGAPEDPTADCDDDTMDPDGGNVGPENLPCEPDVFLTAHEAGGAGQYHVPAQGADDLYMCYSFASPFAAGAQATAWAPVIDDDRVIHHWILYKSQSPVEDNGVYPCDVSLQLSSDFVAGWAPGGENVEMPANVGLELGGPGEYYVLQVHYHNTAHYEDALDASGVAFCTADTPRANTAGVITLGTVGINIPPGAQMHPATGNCGWLSTSSWPEMHIIGSSPHMHELGRAFRTQLTRQAGAGMEMVIDIPNFNFANQLMYFNEQEIVVQPGDTLQSTCWFTNDTGQSVGFGEGTGDEMCFNFMLAYPIDQIANRNCGIIF